MSSNTDVNIIPSEDDTENKGSSSILPTNVFYNYTKKKIIDYTKTNFTEEEKYIIRNEVEIIKEKYPNYIPIIVKVHNDKTIKLTKFKFLVTNEITLAQFLCILRKKITNIKSTESIFILINNTLMPITLNLSSIYKEKKDKDTNMLFITICKENTFGKYIAV